MPHFETFQHDSGLTVAKPKMEVVSFDLVAGDDDGDAQTRGALSYEIADPSLVSAMVKLAKETDAVAVIGNLTFIELDGTRYLRDPSPYLELGHEHHGTPDDPLAQVVFSLAPMMNDREAFDTIGGFDESLRYAEMTDLFLRLVARFGIERVIHSPNFGYNCTRQAGSVSSDRKKMDNARKLVLWRYAHDTILWPNGEKLKKIIPLGRSAVTGAQHFQLVTDKGPHVPPWLSKFEPFIPAGQAAGTQA